MSRNAIVSFAVVGLMLGWCGVSRAEDDCKTILAKAIQAHGGEEKLAKIHAIQLKTEEEGGNFVIQGNNQQQKSVVEISYLFPDKYKSVTTTELLPGANLNITTVYSKGKGSRQFGGQQVKIQGQDQEKDLGEAELKEIKEQIHRMQITTRLVSLKDAAYTLSPLAEEKVANKPAVGFKVKAKGFRDLDLFFDKTSGLLVKTRYETEGEKGKKTTEEKLVKEYQKVDGISVPKKVGLNRDGKEVREVEYLETKLLPTMDEKEFDKPSSK